MAAWRDPSLLTSLGKAVGYPEDSDPVYGSYLTTWLAWVIRVTPVAAVA